MSRPVAAAICGVVGHLVALVPGQGLAQQSAGSWLIAWRSSLPATASAPWPRGQVQQHHEAGGALDQGADRGPVLGADDQVALPVAGHRPVLDLGWPLADVDHVRDPPRRSAGPALRRGWRSARPVRSRSVSSRRSAPRPCT